MQKQRKDYLVIVHILRREEGLIPLPGNATIYVKKQKNNHGQELLAGMKESKEIGIVRRSTRMCQWGKKEVRGIEQQQRKIETLKI